MKITFKKQVDFISACRKQLGLSLSDSVEVYKYARYIKSRNSNFLKLLCKPTNKK